ncbi:MAG: hypothetical protein CMP59_08500 [Flavobacteriales bacterium]|nr:hypothetical protein [Flavobacteriales bacterium]
MNSEFVYAIGAFLEATFQILPILGNLPNILFTLTIGGGFVYWMMELKKYKEEARHSGGIE